jgi:hypothetical protein
MFLVEHYQAEVGLWGKERAPGAYDDVRFTVPYFAPFVILLAW